MHPEYPTLFLRHSDKKGAVAKCNSTNEICHADGVNAPTAYDIGKLRG